MKPELLSKLGLTDKEVAVFLAVLRKRQIDPANLAKEVGIKRTTAYHMARSLVERGLLIEDATRRPRLFMPAAPEEVRVALVNEKRILEERENLYEKLADELSLASAEDTYPVPTIKFVEEPKLASHLNQRSRVWYESMREAREWTWWGFQDHTFLEHFPEWVDRSWRQAPEKFELKLLTNLTAVEKGMEGKHAKRSVKYWGEATNFASSTWIAGDYVIMVNTRNHPFYLVEIHDKLMAHDQREVFRNLWELV